MLQEDICQVTEADLQIFEIALRNGYHLPNQQNSTFSIWKKKQKKVVIILH